jgi:hypothetical protein
MVLGKKITFMIMMLIAASIFLIYQVFFTINDTAYRPWYGYAFHKEANIFKFGFSNFKFDYETRDECLQDINWKTLEQSPNDFRLRDSPSKPVGCSFASNNYWKAYIMNAIMSGREVKYICEALDPQFTKGQMRYQGALEDAVKASKSNKFSCSKLVKF